MKNKIKILMIIVLFGIAIFFSFSSFATTVTTTIDVPGTGCEANKPCDIEDGFGPIQSMFGSLIKYFSFLAGLGAVLFIIINGIMYSMSGMNTSMKDEAKKRIGATLIGLILLFLSGYILKILAPWVYN